MNATRGFLNLNKPSGVTSRDVVDLIARPLRRAKMKVGHAGTLDPLATGVLVVAVGAATRLIEFVQEQTKTYRALVRLGATSDTDDADGTVQETRSARVPSEDEVRAALATFVGTIQQRPPSVSAVKLQGKRAYDLARRGEAPELTPRPVRIDRIDIVSYTWPQLDVEVICGGGTYVRAIARDLGEFLGCGGMIEALKRTRIGAFTLDAALDPTAIDWTPETIAARLLPLSLAVAGLPAVSLNEEQAMRVRRGQSLAVARLSGPAPGPGMVALFGGDEVAAVAEHDCSEGILRPRKVLDGAS